MYQYKPKHLAIILNIPPERVSVLAQQIEQSKLYRFKKTPLGSYIFKQDDIEVISEFFHISLFFNKRKQVNEMLRYKLSSYKQEEERPQWFKHLKNANVLT